MLLLCFAVGLLAGSGRALGRGYSSWQREADYSGDDQGYLESFAVREGVAGTGASQKAHCPPGMIEGFSGNPPLPRTPITTALEDC